MGHLRPRLRTVLATVAALGAAGVLVAGAMILGGLYDVASTTQHWQPTYSVLDLAMRRSVKRQARDIAEPPLADEHMALRGAGCFRDKCVQCHGGVAVPPGEIGRSMQPLPGPLLDASRRWQPRELYWLTRHGIRMSGMPAWEFRLHDQEIWDLVAFLQRLPAMDAPTYLAWMQRAPAAPACGRNPDAAAGPTVPDAERGRTALHQYACQTCHAIPGVTGPRTFVGPSLERIGERKLLAGQWPNTAQNMARWIVAPQQLKPGTLMPDLGVPEHDARDMAAYLATLR